MDLAAASCRALFRVPPTYAAGTSLLVVMAFCWFECDFRPLAFLVAVFLVGTCSVYTLSAAGSFLLSESSPELSSAVGNRLGVDTLVRFLARCRFSTLTAQSEG